MKFPFIASVIISFVFASCSSKYYSESDYSKVEKIDAHVHLFTSGNILIKQAEAENFKLFTINAFLGDCNWTDQQFELSVNQMSKFPDQVRFAAAFCLDRWDEPDWVDNTLQTIKERIAQGSKGIKVWKNIGMVLRDENDKLVMIDNPRFDPIFKFMAEKNIPLIGHIGEPKNCWLPINEMTTTNDQRAFTRNPKYHMYLHPEMPSYEEQIKALENVLLKNPELVYIGCHLGSLEWSTDRMAQFFDQFPNSAFDMAARMGHLFHLTAEDPEKVRSFFIKYQDRLLYGTDLSEIQKSKKEELIKNAHDTWVLDWKYFVTDESMSSPLLVSGKAFKGVKLPKSVVDKIYRINAQKWIKYDE